MNVPPARAGGTSPPSSEDPWHEAHFALYTPLPVSAWAFVKTPCEAFFASWPNSRVAAAANATRAIFFVIHTLQLKKRSRGPPPRAPVITLPRAYRLVS